MDLWTTKLSVDRFCSRLIRITRVITLRRVTSLPQAGRSSRLRLCRQWRRWTRGEGGATTRTTWPSGHPSTRRTRSSAGPTGRRASSMSGQAAAGATRMTRAVGGAAVPRPRATESPTGGCGTRGTERGWPRLHSPRPLSPPTEHQVGVDTMFYLQRISSPHSLQVYLLATENIRGQSSWRARNNRAHGRATCRPSVSSLNPGNHHTRVRVRNNFSWFLFFCDIFYSLGHWGGRDREW